jgi:hypothetical protein
MFPIDLVNIQCSRLEEPFGDEDDDESEEIDMISIMNNIFQDSTWDFIYSTVY